MPNTRGVDDVTQGGRLSRAYLTYLAHGVEVFFWYEFRDGGKKPDYNEHNFGMIELDLKPKPALAAMKTLTGMLGHAPTFAAPPAEAYPGISGLRVTGRGRKAYDVYWALEGERTLPLEGSEVEAVHTHSFPRTLRPSNTGRAFEVRLDEAPVFIER